MNLQETLDDAVQFATAVFKDKGEVAPMWIAHYGDMRVPICTPWRDAASKQQTYDTLRNVFRLAGVERFAVMTEAWMLMLPDGKIPDSHLHGASLASHPERRELLIVRAEDRTASLQKAFFILRPEHGKPTLVEAKLPQPTSEEGNMVGLLR